MEHSNRHGLPVLSVIHTGSIWDERAMRKTRGEKTKSIFPFVLELDQKVDATFISVGYDNSEATARR